MPFCAPSTVRTEGTVPVQSAGYRLPSTAPTETRSTTSPARQHSPPRHHRTRSAQSLAPNLTRSWRLRPPEALSENRQGLPEFGHVHMSRNLCGVDEHLGLSRNAHGRRGHLLRHHAQMYPYLRGGLRLSKQLQPELTGVQRVIPVAEDFRKRYLTSFGKRASSWSLAERDDASLCSYSEDDL